MHRSKEAERNHLCKICKTSFASHLLARSNQLLCPQVYILWPYRQNKLLRNAICNYRRVGCRCISSNIERPLKSLLNCCYPTLLNSSLNVLRRPILAEKKIKRFQRGLLMPSDERAVCDYGNESINRQHCPRATSLPYTTTTL